MSSGTKRFVRNGFLISGGIALFLLLARLKRRKERRERERELEKASSYAVKLARAHEEEKLGKKKKSPGVDGRFLKQLVSLLQVLIPSLNSPEFGYTAVVAGCLVARTALDVWTLSNTSRVERAIITGDHRKFRWSLLELISVMLPISFVNQFLKYGLDELKLRFRERLTRHLFAEYMKGYTFYGANNLDTRVSNVDQLICEDVKRFCNSVVDLYSNVSKPALDILLYASRLSVSIGAQGPALMLSYLAVTGTILTTLRRPLSKLTVQEQQLDGEWRLVNSRLITNSEEIAFYNGGPKESHVVMGVFERVILQIRKSMEFRFSIGIIDNIIAKYCATLVGFYSMSNAFLREGGKQAQMGLEIGDKVEEYYRSGRMLMNMAVSVGRLVLAGRELARLSGFTSRVVDLQEVLRDLNNKKYVRHMIHDDGGDGERFKPNSGKIVENNELIEFDRVPLVTPNGDVLVRSLSFKVPYGINTFVAGPNGCGKSSLFRVLGELWPLFGGVLQKPKNNELFYVCQRPYMTLGTLRDQVIYPKIHDSSVNDDHLMDLLRLVRLDYLVAREGGWDSVNDFMDVLSGGEKQRLAMARLFYHKPRFAVLDECTSAVSFDVEADIYNHCRCTCAGCTFSVFPRLTTIK